MLHKISGCQSLEHLAGLRRIQYLGRTNESFGQAAASKATCIPAYIYAYKHTYIRTNFL